MLETAGAALVLLVVAVLALASRRAARREKRLRLDLLADCSALLENPVVTPDKAGFGVLRGTLDGRRVALRPFADTLTFRRLPQLWLAATVEDDVAACPTLEVLRRATGAEFYAAGARLPSGLATPDAWPRDATVRGSQDAAPLLMAVAPALAGHIASPRMKSLFLSSKGARVIRQAAEGGRGAFLVFRDTRFPITRVALDDARAALVAALAAVEARNAALGEREPHAAAA